jgi:hypothetical protein
MATRRTPTPPNRLRDFAAFILTNGRPDNVITYDTLKRSGYTGRIVLLVDDLDPKRAAYVKRYGDEVVVFDKRAIAKTFDQGDNFNDMRAIIYARNASFEVAKQLGLRYFIQLDDDYRHFQFRFDDRLAYHPRVLKDLDRLFAALLDFYVTSGVHAVAVAQGGDFIGGEQSPRAQKVALARKCMNSFLCSVDRPFKFIGRINEDVNAYTRLASTGLLMFTTNQVTLEQTQTQTNPGGMSELYLDSGTYVKSFYSVMYSPSSVKVAVIQSKSPRLHHRVAWRNAVPKVLREKVKKRRAA